MPFCTRRQFDRMERKLDAVLEQQEILLNKENKMAATLADLDAELAKSDTSVAAIKADNDKILAILAAGPQTTDVTAQVTHLQNVNAALAAIQAADDSALNPPTPTPTPTPAPAA